MEIVIKIDEEKYKAITEMYGTFPKEMKDWGVEAIKNGTPIPKGHGRLIDEKDLSLMTVHMIDGMLVCDAPTIIEADRGSKNNGINNR